VRLHVVLDDATNLVGEKVRSWPEPRRSILGNLISLIHCKRRKMGFLRNMVHLAQSLMSKDWLSEQSVWTVSRQSLIALRR
jgi:hypothetical protein